MGNRPPQIIMAQADYIPAGRTSRIVRGSSEIQIQTEYAQRPVPRLTTSIFSKGQVMHKIEQELPNQINSFEDKMRVEDMLRKQHFEVIKILKEGKKLQPLMNTTQPGTSEDPIYRRITRIKGVERVFHVDNEGNFSSDQVSKEFKTKFQAISKGMLDILNIFSMMPGGEREKGVYEVEPDRLYLASCGKECFFVLARPLDRDIDFESEIRSAITQ